MKITTTIDLSNKVIKYIISGAQDMLIDYNDEGNVIPNGKEGCVPKTVKAFEERYKNDLAFKKRFDQVISFHANWGVRSDNDEFINSICDEEWGKIFKRS